jgi:hypothetical protein
MRLETQTSDTDLYSPSLELHKKVISTNREMLFCYFPGQITEVKMKFSPKGKGKVYYQKANWSKVLKKFNHYGVTL